VADLASQEDKFENQMKNISLILLFGTWLFSSCETREEKEMRSLLQVVSVDVLDTNGPKVIFEDADNDWFTYWFGECSQLVFVDLDSTAERKENQFRYFNKMVEPIMETLSFEEVCGICEEAKKPYQFKSSMFLKGITISSEEKRKDSLEVAFTDIVLSDNPLGETNLDFVKTDKELKKYDRYFKISKPIFIKNYEYALVYLKSDWVSLLLYKKINGKWVYVHTVNSIIF
jgi:hypothetical protein